MGRRGPKPLSVEEKARRGTLEKSREVRRAEKPPPAESPRMPEWLEAEGRRVWFRVVPRLDALGVLTKLDGDQLGNFCAAQALVIRLEREAQTAEPLIETKAGTASNPIFKMLREARAQAQSLAKEFGLTPASRVKFAQPAKPEEPTEQEDPLAEFDTGPDDATQGPAEA